ncbi:polyketide synthase dehydratase domain-containing protein [Streptomyces thinghirensis]|nr:polyketide synthase dehydratase domain-containing protein [Streptomyces thinghirensis]
MGRKTDDHIPRVHRDLHRHRRQPRCCAGTSSTAAALLPGVGYVDLVLQVLARHGHPMPEVELRNLTILAPLVAGPGEAVRTTVEGRPVDGGGWRVEVRSRRAQDTTDVLHAVVTAHHRDPVTFTERLPLPSRGASRRTTMDEIYTWCRGVGPPPSGLMKLGGAVHHRPGDWIAEVELAPEHQSSTGAFLFHPALFEAGLLGGGVALGMLHGDNDGPGLYLPLMFDRFRAAGPLGGRCLRPGASRLRPPRRRTHPPGRGVLRRGRSEGRRGRAVRRQAHQGGRCAWTSRRATPPRRSGRRCRRRVLCRLRLRWWIPCPFPLCCGSWWVRGWVPGGRGGCGSGVLRVGVGVG